jgi:hypothetical protein
MTSFTENQPFKQQAVPAAMYVFIRRWVKWQEVPMFFNNNLPLIAEAMEAAGAPPQYPPSVFIHKLDEPNQSSELSVAIQTNEPVVLTGGGTIQFPAGQALVAQHIGQIGQTETIHQAMSAYVDQNRLTVGIAIEEYREMQTAELEANQSETWIIYRLYDGIEVPRILC